MNGLVRVEIISLTFKLLSLSGQRTERRKALPSVATKTGQGYAAISASLVSLTPHVHKVEDFSVDFK